jgi:hypothetical protein
MGHYIEVFAEMLDCLLESRLYDESRSVDLAVLGGDDAQQIVREMIRPFEKIRIAYASNDYAEYEFPALALLQAACREADGPVYYLHTKGVSRSRLDQHARYWRALMLGCVVENHAKCLRALVDHDCAGTNWRGNHYSGNFWWSRAEHIRRLPDIHALRRAPTYVSADPVWNARVGLKAHHSREMLNRRTELPCRGRR